METLFYTLLAGLIGFLCFHFIVGYLIISLPPEGNECYFYTPDDERNDHFKKIFYGTCFSVVVRLYSLKSVCINRIDAFAYHPDFNDWIRLHDSYAGPNQYIADFSKKHPAFPREKESRSDAEARFGKIGLFTKSLPHGNRVLDCYPYTDVFLAIQTTTKTIFLFMTVPELHNIQPWHSPRIVGRIICYNAYDNETIQAMKGYAEDYRANLKMHGTLQRQRGFYMPW